MSDVFSFTYKRWIAFRGYVVTCNFDGSIPLNAEVILDMSMMYPSDAVNNQLNRIAQTHNTLLDQAKT